MGRAPRSVRADCRSLAEQRGVAIVVEAPPEAVGVDRVRLEGAIRNLVANAIRFSPEGGTVRVAAEVTTRRARAGAPGRPWLRVTVLDEGPGVDPAVEPRLFLPFPRRGGDGEGAGLGLAVAAAAVRAHGGEIGYRPRPSGVAEFNLDPLSRREFLTVLLEDVRKHGTTVVLSSHIVAELEEACDALVVLSQGRVLLHDSIDAIRRGHVARRLHGTTLREPAGAAPVSTFVGRSGERLELVRATAPPGHEATLEQIVLGYLASVVHVDSPPIGSP